MESLQELKKHSKNIIQMTYTGGKQLDTYACTYSEYPAFQSPIFNCEVKYKYAHICLFNMYVVRHVIHQY